MGDDKPFKMFSCWKLLKLYQYSETNVMHFLFSLLRIKGLYMFWASLTHPHEGPHERNLVYCMHVIWVGCTWCIQYTKCHFCYTSWGWASNAQNIYRPLIFKSASCWFHYTDDILWCMVNKTSILLKLYQN
jgi:hypothetical protein